MLKACAATDKDCGVPTIEGSKRSGIDLNQSVSLSASNRTYGNVAAGQYRCTRPSSSSTPRLYKVANWGEACEIDGQCSAQLSCISRYYRNYSGTGGPWGSLKRCGHLEQCVHSNGTPVAYNSSLGASAGRRICQAGQLEGHPGTWYQVIPDNQVVAKHRPSMYSKLDSPKYGVEVDEPNHWCASGKAQRWLDGQRWICLPSNKACVRLNQSAVSAGQEMTHGGKKYRCNSEEIGWRLADGESCTSKSQCGVMSLCTSNPGGKHCMSTFKKCSWRDKAGYPVNKVKTWQGHAYKCQSNHVWKRLK
ncbi:MAG: hypothetical protein KC766_09260 [Myxococcales bacterium]|nr:hypothetical protein [Myxococcales bacterium]